MVRATVEWQQNKDGVAARLFAPSLDIHVAGDVDAVDAIGASVDAVDAVGNVIDGSNVKNVKMKAGVGSGVAVQDAASLAKLVVVPVQFDYFEHPRADMRAEYEQRFARDRCT
jgi:hypothetical protein